MTKTFIGQVLLCGFLLLPPLSADTVDRDERIPVSDIGKIVVDGGNLAEVRLGINIVATSATVRSWKGEELVIAHRGHTSLGRLAPLTVAHTQSGDELTLSLTREISFGIGIRVGKVEIELLIPEAWDGELELRDFPVETCVEGLRAGTLSGNMKLADLTVRDSAVETVILSMGADSNFQAENVRAGSWLLTGKLGVIKARNITGDVTAETVDGDIYIDFADFRGTSRLSSRLGKITVYLPADSELELSLSSPLESAETDFTVQGVVGEGSTHEIKGHVGSSGNILTARSGGGRVQVLAK